MDASGNGAAPVEALPSLQSWNTSLSRTGVSSLHTARLSESSRIRIQGLEDVLKTVQSLQLPRCPYNQVDREEVVGEGETFLVERCRVQKELFAIKHLKLGVHAAEPAKLLRRLHSILLEIRIMWHTPLRNHPNILTLKSYGWNTQYSQILPYILVEFCSNGTLRQHLRTHELGISAKQVLMGDIAAGLDALHDAGVVHGDVKLDNVLVSHAWDRPAGVIAKLSDFGHSLLTVNKQGQEEVLTYHGTPAYNAPEVRMQATNPIHPKALQKCDVWAYGLLAWEIIMDGEYYFKSIPGSESASGNDGILLIDIDPSTLLELAEDSLRTITASFQRQLMVTVFRMTLKPEAHRRIPRLTRLPVMSKWNHATVPIAEVDAELSDLVADWSYEMFRPETGAEIPWLHEQQIFKDLERYHDSGANTSQLKAASAWQLAGCHYFGFGTLPDRVTARHYANIASEQGHPVPSLFSHLLFSLEDPVSPADTYPSILSKSFRLKTAAIEAREQVLVFRGNQDKHLPKRLKRRSLHDLSTQELPSQTVSFDEVDFESCTKLSFLAWKDFQAWVLNKSRSPLDSYCVQSPHSSNRPMSLIEAAIFNQDYQNVEKFYQRIPEVRFASVPPIIQACRMGDAEMVCCLLKAGADPNSTGPDGCNLFHWLFLLYHEDIISIEMNLTGKTLDIDAPSVEAHYLHRQWPLELIGSPLAFAVSTANKDAVIALLRLGADPFARAYHSDQFPASDHRSTWTPVHIAVKYHLADILSTLLAGKNAVPTGNAPLACALAFSTPMERMVLHGAKTAEAIQETIRLLVLYEALGEPSVNGMTSLMQAIDFNDLEVASALVDADPPLAKTRFVDPKNPTVYNTPCHWAAQISARRDVPDSSAILFMLFKRDARTFFERDSDGRTPLHLAVTGPSARAADWLISQLPGLLDIEDNYGRTALHYCASEQNCSLLLQKGANVNHTDKLGLAPTHRFCLDGAAELVSSILKYRPLLYLRNNDYGTPLHCAVQKGSREATLELLKAGAAPNMTDNNEVTPLMIAIRAGRRDLVEALLQNEADVSVTDKMGNSVLHDAVLCGNIPIATRILSTRVSLTQANNLGETCFHTCARCGSVEMMDLLCSKGLRRSTPIFQRNRKGQTPFHVAALYARADIGKLLLQKYQAEADDRDSNGNTALHLAIEGPPDSEFERPQLQEVLKFCSLLGTNQGCFLQANSKKDLPWDLAWNRCSKEDTYDLVEFFMIKGGAAGCRGLRSRKGENRGNLLLKIALQKKIPSLCEALIQTKLIDPTNLPDRFVKSALHGQAVDFFRSTAVLKPGDRFWNDHGLTSQELEEKLRPQKTQPYSGPVESQLPVEPHLPVELPAATELPRIAELPVSAGPTFSYRTAGDSWEEFFKRNGVI